MSLGWHNAHRVLRTLGKRLARTERTAVVLMDAGVAETPIARRMSGWLAQEGWGVEQIDLAGAGDLRSVLELADRLAVARVVVGVGGGALLDQAKLATLLCGNQHAYLTVPQRSGIVILPLELSRPVPLIAVPTTLGTGSEVSTVACLQYPDGKRLIATQALRPEAAVLDPVATETLPAELVLEGVLEVLSRIASPYVADHRDLPTEDALAEVVAERVMRVGHQAHATRVAGRPLDGELRLEIAKLSGISHGEWICRAGDPYAVKGWLLANELSATLGIRKMTAVAALFPHLWRAVSDGDARLGSAERLTRIWSRLRTCGQRAMPQEPATGIAALIDEWRVDRRIVATPEQLDSVARRTTRAWGAGLPMLGGLTTGDIRELLARATDTREPVVV